MRTFLPLAGAALAASAHAQTTWNVATDFSPVFNPTTAWSYGWKEFPAGPFALFDRAFYVTPTLPGWTSSQFPSSSPLVSVNSTNAAQSVSGTMITVPAAAAWFQAADGRIPVYRWTSPGEAVFHIFAFYHSIDPANQPHQALIIAGGRTIFSYLIPPEGSTLPDAAIRLGPGETVDFMLVPVPGSSLPGSYSLDATITGTFECYPNCSHDVGAVPFLNVNDILCFMFRFAADQSLPPDQQLDAYTNCDHSTIPPVLNVNDFLCFQQRFAVGCSAP